MNKLMNENEVVDRDITAELLNFRGADCGLVGSRNWLSIEQFNAHNLIAKWHLEETGKGAKPPPYSKVISACSSS